MGRRRGAPTLNRLSCRTRLMAASSLEGDSFVWNTTPNDPLPTILHCVYCSSRVSPVMPSWTFSRMTSTSVLVSHLPLTQSRGSWRPIALTSHPQVAKRCWAIRGHLDCSLANSMLPPGMVNGSQGSACRGKKRRGALCGPCWATRGGEPSLGMAGAGGLEVGPW
jgi:hypothetical protein